MILQLKKGWLDRQYFVDKFKVDIVANWREVWSDYEQDELLTIGDERIELTRRGLLQVDGLLPAFFESEHQGVRYT